MLSRLGTFLDDDGFDPLRFLSSVTIVVVGVVVDDDADADADELLTDVEDSRSTVAVFRFFKVLEVAVRTCELEVSSIFIDEDEDRLEVADEEEEEELAPDEEIQRKR
jgi:hypothetical protein